MDNQSFFVAIDVSKDELSVAVDGARVCSYPHTNNGIARLRRWAEQRAQGLALWFVMESTGVYSTSLATRLVERYAATVSIVNARRIRDHARAEGCRSKTDSADARAILSYAQKYQLRPWQPLKPVLRQLKQLTRQIQALTTQLQVISNREHAQSYEADLHAAITQSNDELRSVYEEQLDLLDQAIIELVKEDKELAHDVQLLVTIPSVGFVSAYRLLAFTDGLLRERNPKQLTGYAGLAPAHRESGSSVRGRSRIDKQGCAHLRGVLYMCSLTAIVRNAPLKAFYERLQYRKKNPLAKKQAQVAVMRKLLLIARAVLVSGKPFDPSLVGTGA